MVCILDTSFYVAFTPKYQFIIRLLICNLIDTEGVTVVGFQILSIKHVLQRYHVGNTKCISIHFDKLQAFEIYFGILAYGAICVPVSYIIHMVF